MPRTIPIRALAFRHSGRWYAQCLEFDICVQAPTADLLLPELGDILSAYIAAAVEQGHEPFQGLPPAPQQFFDMYERSADWADAEPPLQTIEDAPRIVPAVRVLRPETA